MGCLLMAIPAMATTVGAQTVDDETNTTNDTSFAFDATLDNETVTVSVTENDTAVENASVSVNGTDAGTTDENGTLQFGLENRSAVDIGVTVDNTTQSTIYEVVDGSLVEQTESTDETTDFAFDPTLDNEMVTVSVTSNGTAVENATVAVNESDVGSTDANGTLQFPLENRSAVEIAVTVDGTTQTTIYEVVGGELITQESAEDAQEVPDEAADQVSTIQKLISAFRNGEFEKLGPIVSEAAGGGPPADVGNGSENAGNGQGNAPENAGNGNAPENAGNGNAPENAGNGNAPENAGNGQGNAPENASDGQGNAPEDAGNGQGNSGSNGGSDRGSGDQGNGGSGNSGGQGNGGQGNGQGAGGR